MADPTLVESLRRLIGEPVEAESSYSDATLSLLLDASGGSLNDVALTIWREKAAGLANLVDISEGGSSRKNSQLQGQALAMVRHFEEQITVAATSGATRIARLAR